MSASKIKNLILLILLLGVLGLLPAVVPTQAARTGAERNVNEKLEDTVQSIEDILHGEYQNPADLEERIKTLKEETEL